MKSGKPVILREWFLRLCCVCGYDMQASQNAQALSAQPHQAEAAGAPELEGQLHLKFVFINSW